jgi:predicted phosphodiesterase
MKVSWLHVSDFHFQGGDPYDRDVVLGALLRAVPKFRARGRQPDLIFATGDIAHSGQENEYRSATAFFDTLLEAAGVEKRHLFVVPGNHDVDQKLGIGLARTLESREQADTYFHLAVSKPHNVWKQREFVRWYNDYFAGIRTFPENSTCGPVESINIRGCKIGILPVNSALFCQGKDDHARLWIGRRCLDDAVEHMNRLDAALKIALLHHPFEWLNDTERSNIKTKLQANVDIILRGHLHETDVEHVAGVTGAALHMAAGAAYQTRKWPNRALYGEAEHGRVRVFPIRYEDQPHEVWTVDPGVFPDEPDHARVFAIPR